MLNGKGTSIQLTPLRTPISNGALVADKLPTRLKLSHWGDNPSVKGNVRLSDLSARVLPVRQKTAGFEKIALDFEHNTVPGSPEYERTTEPRRVAAYGVPRVINGEGLFLEELEWTPVGKLEALNYADLSPAVELDEHGNILFIHSAALTRNGAVEGLSFFSVTIPNQNTMDPLKPENVITVAEFAPVVGLAATASKADVLGKLALLSALAMIVVIDDKKITKLGALEVKDGKIVLPDFTALDGRVKTLETAGNRQLATLSATLDGKVITLTAEDLAKFGGRIEKLETSLTATATATADRERETLIARFSVDGKVPLTAEGKAYPDEELRKLDVPTLKLLHANTPVTVPLHARARRPSDDAINNPSAHGFVQLVTLNVSKGKTKAQALDLAIKENPEGYKAWRDSNGQPGI